MVVTPPSQNQIGGGQDSSPKVPVTLPGLAPPTEQSPPPTKSGEKPPPMTDGTEYFNGEVGQGANGGMEYFGPGIMEKCEQASANALERLREAKEFRAACGPAQKGPTQRIAVNDYSVRPAYMFIFDENDKCIGKTMVAFGNGAGGAQVACNDSGSHLSPAGFHLTAAHHGGGKFNPHNSLKMVGLQSQGSVGRGILIHGSAAPGTASTWGCAGVPYSAFKAVQTALGYGALVYNYFSPQQIAGRCGNRNGFTPDGRSCRLDPGSPNVPMANGGTPAVAWWNALIGEPADAALPPLPPREFIKKGTEVTIYRYLKPSDTYEISMVKEEAQGPNVVTAEALRTALEINEPLADFKKRLARDTGATYVLRKNIPLLWGREIYKRQQQRKKKAR